jgi:hypothetical protein
VPGVTGPVIALAVTVIAHVIGAAVLIWAMMGSESVDWRRELWPRDDDGRGPGPDGPPRDDPPDDGGGVPLPVPLPNAAPSPVRLREPGRIADGYPRPPRRPEHAPRRPRVPAER